MRLKMMLLSLSLLALIGCGQSYQYSVYGRTGAKYQAPALCEALTKCLNSPNEQECYYEHMQTSSGESLGCEGVKK
jgi:hypothetical protein